MNEEALRSLARLTKAQRESFHEAERVNSLLLEPRTAKELASISARELSADTYRKNSIYRLFLEHGEAIPSLVWTSYKPLEPFLYEEAGTDSRNIARTRSSVGYFKEEFPFPAIIDKRDETVWMSLIPHEMNTMERHLKEVSGNVLVLGGGLLYFPLMAAMNPRVKSIHVIEIDQEILDIDRNILGITPLSEKISLEEGNAIELSRNTSSYDHVFADLWHMAEDGIPPYLALLENEKENPGTKFHYWIEEEMIIYLRECVLVYLEEVADGLPAKEPEAYEDYEGQPVSDAIVHTLRRMRIEERAKDAESLLRLLSRDSIRSLAKEIRPDWRG